MSLCNIYLNSKKLAKFTFIDLFSGIGGFHLGLKRNGGICLGYSEIEKNAINAYCANHGMEYFHNLGDITKIKNLPKHDFLTAGVPCQSWSIAGKNLGFNDDRGQLWNDTIYLLNKSRPKAFIFENVKGLSDPRNQNALNHILKCIKTSGYTAKVFVLNSFDYGVLQNRIRVYIIGFEQAQYMDKFKLPTKIKMNKKLYDVLDHIEQPKQEKKKFSTKELFGNSIPSSRTRFQKLDEVNDFFLFNDIRNGHSTIHSWDLIVTNKEEKELCNVILKNRRKKKYGKRDGNPLSLNHLKDLIPSLSHNTVKSLVEKNILRVVEYSYNIDENKITELSQSEEQVLQLSEGTNIDIDSLAIANKALLAEGIKYNKIITNLSQKNILSVDEVRYEFKNSKISSGIFGVNRIYLPNSEVFSTLVASDTNDFIATKDVEFKDIAEYKKAFIKQIFLPKNYRKITKEEACKIQGFPPNFKLQEKRTKWMKLLGNSVSVPVVEKLANAVVQTGVFNS